VRSNSGAGLACAAAVAFCLGGCALPQSNVEADNEARVVDDKDTQLERSTGLVTVDGVPFTGVVEQRDPWGGVIERTHLREGLKHGLREKWFASGQKSFSAKYADGKRHGTSTTWWRHGAVRSKSHHIFGVAQGTQRQWYASGALFKEMQLVDGREQGLQRSWRENGKLYNNYEAHGDRVFGLKRSKLCFRVDEGEPVGTAKELKR